MTFFKALCKYIKANIATDDTNEFYPVKPPQKASLPYTTFNIEEDSTDPTHSGGYPSGSAVVQFDFFDQTIAGQDARVKAFKDAFVGQSFDLDSSVQMAFCESYNEQSNFGDLEGLVIRSIDLRIRYNFK